MNNYELGKKWERKLSKIIQDAGGHVLWTAKYSDNEQEAPAIVGHACQVIIPDLLVFSLGSGFLRERFDGHDKLWIEVKFRDHAVTHQNKPKTGLAFALYKQYIKTQRISGIPVYILFVQDRESALVGDAIDNLAVNDSMDVFDTHNADGSRTRMIAWDVSTLRQYGILETQEADNLRKTRMPAFDRDA